MRPSVDVIIPAYNEEEVLADCLEALVNQTLTDFKAYIINDESTDTTRDIILDFEKRHPQKIHLREFGKVGPGRARNMVAKESSAEILAFTDADCIPTPSWLEELIRGFDQDSIGALGGPHFCTQDSNVFQNKLERFLNFIKPFVDFYKTDTKEVSEVKHNPLCNVAYRRNIFLQLGGFREDLFPGEDLEMDVRVREKGFKIFFNPKALVFHHRPKSSKDFAKVMFAYGRAQGKMTRERGPFRLIHFVGLVFPILLMSSFYALSLKNAVLTVGLTMILAILPLRPNGYIGILLSFFDWMRGYWQGLITNRSPAPGSPHKASG